jgi:hypothetical protein
MITSEKPLFFAADATVQAQLRPGVWAEERTGCDFDEGRPPGAGDHYPYLLVRGEPPLHQVEMTDATGKPAAMSTSRRDR